MLIGKFEHGVEKGSFSFNFTFFVETDEKARQAPCIAGQINEFYLSQQNLVTVFGEKNDRFMLIVASQLEDIESYRALVDFHLTNPAIFDMKCLELCSKLKEIPECLIRAFLFENDRLATIDSLPEEDPFLCYLNHGKYEFNDFILAETSTPCPKEVRCPLESAACETAQLLRVITTYPPPNGFVINVIKIREEIHCYSINCRSEKKKIVTIKPKYPVNAFNMFAKSGRESVKREFSQFPITNNQLNQIMGQRWKEMSPEQKLPFLQLAEADKIRYKEEMKHAQGKKPLSDYNYFVQQEKQFISSTLPKNTSTAIGKHAGDRWSTIHSEEKRLYEILRSVDEEAYEKQFMR